MTALLLALLAAADGGQQLASGDGSATWAAHRPVHFAVRSYAASVEVAVSPSDSVTVWAPGNVQLVAAGGDRVEAVFAGKRQIHDGAVRVALPRGSSVDVSAVSGPVTVAGVGGDARVRGMSGAVRVEGAAEVDVETVDGAVDVSGASGAMRIHTVSGRSTVNSARPGTKLELETASGPVDFRGACAAGCHLDIDSVSGDVRFALDSADSASARVVSTSGKIRDDLGLALHRGSSEGDFSEGTLGRGDGLIECETFSGSVTFAGR